MTALDLNAKTSMSQLLLKDTFHGFAFIEGEVTTFNKFHIDGQLRKEFFDEEPSQEYSLWKDVQDYFFSVIRGTRTPLSFKLILSLAREDFPAFLKGRGLSYQSEEIQGLYLNFRYDGKDLQCVTGTSMHTFTMDKGLDQEWDKYVKQFFSQAVILH